VIVNIWILCVTFKIWRTYTVSNRLLFYVFMFTKLYVFMHVHVCRNCIHIYIYNTVWVIEITISTNTLGQQYLKYNLQIILYQIKNNQRTNTCLVRMLKSYKKLVLHKKFAMVYMYILLQIIYRNFLQISLYNFWKITIFLITLIIQKQSF